MRRHLWRVVMAAGTVAVLLASGGASWLQEEGASAQVTLRGRTISVRTYGSRGRPPVIVSSGDGGWIHLAPHAAGVLASNGYFVVGIDSREYLSRFSTSAGALAPSDVPGDFRIVAQLAASGSREAPILVGVSEGAALSVLAATTDATRQQLRGVVAVGLPDIAELGWHWRDSMIYFTHKVPNEPTFSTADVIASVSPLPMAAIHSSHDEFAPLASVRVVMERAKEPKRLWVIDAADHGFSDKRKEFDACLLEAMAWIADRR